MNRELALLGGVGIGAALMYLLDPDRGNRRRAIARDKFLSAARHTPDAVGTTARDLSNRARGLVAEIGARFREDDASDDVVEARVRAAMGRVVSHPHAVHVVVREGRATLSGPVLEHEVDDLLTCVSGVRGVREVENHLEAHEDAGNIPSLQGGRRRPGNRFELMQEHWSPSARFLVGALGGGLALWGLGRRDAAGISIGLVGAGLLARGATNTDFSSLLGFGRERDGREVQKTVSIAAPVEEVYRFWSNYENFPRFMKNVLEVKPTGDGRSHWVVEGAAGVPVEWDAVTTRQVPNEVLAWKSVEGASVENSGVVRFTPEEDGTTRVQVRLSYNPPAGALGHAVAALFGDDPKRKLDEDLAKMKSLIETGEGLEPAARAGGVEKGGDDERSKTGAPAPRSRGASAR